jgi:tetratricopeptide (TPR) repeat protein
MKNVLDEWCSIHSNSHIPWLVRGSFYISYAWLIRGTGSAKTVKKKAWPKFRENLRLAKNDLERSWELNPNDPNSSSLLMEVAIGLKSRKEKFEQYFQNGLSACPWHFKLHLEKLRYLKPKWYGSTKEMFSFAEQCLALSEQYPYLGLVMVEALYEAHYFISKDENFLGRDDVWPKVEKIYTVFFDKFPNDIRRRFYYAYHAQIAKKYDVAFEQFEIIGDRWLENTCWDSIKYYNNGRSLAYIKKGNYFLLKKRLYEISIDYFEKAVKCNPNDHAYYRLGQAYMYSGLTTQNLAYLQNAEETLKKAIQLKGPAEKYAKGELKKLRKY